MFQCSSASRKFLNAVLWTPPPYEITFQCSSASRKFLNSRSFTTRRSGRKVSVLFSEPKIPQSSAGLRSTPRREVSVLFSEPKIPQYVLVKFRVFAALCFSALQRAENSSMRFAHLVRAPSSCFSALQRAENSSIRRRRGDRRSEQHVSVLFSEPKIPQ